MYSHDLQPTILRGAMIIQAILVNLYVDTLYLSVTKASYKSLPCVSFWLAITLNDLSFHVTLWPTHLSQ
jgi:hypothetical protein